MKSFVSLSLVSVASLMSLSALSQAQHAGDVWLSVGGGKIITGESATEPNVHVFGMELGEDPLDPFYSEEPGIDNAAGTFVSGQMIGFEFVRSIAKWDGSTFVNVGNTVTATKAVGGSTFTATSGPGVVDGIYLAAEADGSWHEHYGWTLNGLGSADPITGVYRMGLRMKSQNGSLVSSDEIWFILNNGDTEENHDEAIDYAIATVPEPMTMTALGLGVAAMLRRRAKK